jgi:NitT/TauT family transport system substrate-binding protein
LINKAHRMVTAFAGISRSWRIVAALLALACAPGVAQAQTRVVVGAASNSELASPIHLAQQRGWFREAGLAVEILDFRGGAPAIQAFVGGGINVCICAVDHVARLQARNIDGVLAVALDTKHSYALVARGDAAFTDLASLRGRRLGITSPGSFTDNTLRWALRRASMNPDRDVEILGAGTGATMRAAIDSARIDAGMMINSDLVNALAGPSPAGYRVILDLRTVPYPSLGLLARRGWLERPDSGARAFTAAVVRGIEAIRTDRSAATAALKEQFPTYSDAVLADLAEDLQARLAPGGLLREAELANLLDMLSVAAPNLPPVTLAQAQPIPPAGR